MTATDSLEGLVGSNPEGITEHSMHTGELLMALKCDFDGWLARLAGWLA